MSVLRTVSDNYTFPGRYLGGFLVSQVVIISIIYNTRSAFCKNCQVKEVRRIWGETVLSGESEMSEKKRWREGVRKGNSKKEEMCTCAIVHRERKTRHEKKGRKNSFSEREKMLKYRPRAREVLTGMKRSEVDYSLGGVALLSKVIRAD